MFSPNISALSQSSEESFFVSLGKWGIFAFVINILTNEQKMKYPTSLQELYAPEYSHCFGCGQIHPTGLHIRSYLMDSGVEAVCHITPPRLLYGRGAAQSLRRSHGYVFRLPRNGFGCRILYGASRDRSVARQDRTLCYCAFGGRLSSPHPHATRAENYCHTHGNRRTQGGDADGNVGRRGEDCHGDDGCRAHSLLRC